MLKWFSIVALLFQAAPAAADQDNPADQDEVLRLDGWSVDTDDSKAGRRLTVHLTNVGQKPFRMIDATVTFTDILGEGVAGIELDRGLRAEPGERITHSGTVAGLDRLVNMRPANVSASVRVKAVLYADGSTERFGGRNADSPPTRASAKRNPTG